MLLNSARFGGEAPPPPFLVEGVTFPNDDSGLRRGAGLSGAADSKLLTFAYWVRVITWPDFRPISWGSLSAGGASANVPAIVMVQSPQRFLCQAKGVTTSTVIQVTTTNTLSVNTWYCLMGSFDLSDTAKRHLYIGDSSEISVDLWENEAMDFTGGDWSVALAPDLGAEADIECGPLYFSPGQYLDLSVEANRRKFFSATGKPVDAGSDGSLITGLPPLVYVRCIDGAAASTFGNNLGTGGALTISGGPLGIASTSPSD